MPWPFTVHPGIPVTWISGSEYQKQMLKKLVWVVKDFGLGSLGFTKEDFLKEGFVSQIGYPPLRIDILNSIDGIEFTQAFPNKQSVQLESDLSVDYIGLGDLIQNKQSTGRTRDLSDVKELEARIKETKPVKKRKSPEL